MIPNGAIQAFGFGAKSVAQNRPEEPAGATIVRLSPSMIDGDPSQPRRHFDEEKLHELAESLKRHGQIQPIRVRPTGVRGRYMVVAGERRLRAAKLAGFDKIDAVIIAERDNIDAIREEQVVENLQRQDLSPIETAEAYRTLLARWDCSQNELARRLGVGAATVSRALALLQAPDETRERIAGGESVRKATGGGRAPRRKVSEKPDKRRAVELELVSGTVRVKRGYSLEQLVAELRSTLDAERTRSDAA